MSDGAKGEFENYEAAPPTQGTRDPGSGLIGCPVVVGSPPAENDNDSVAKKTSIREDGFRRSVLLEGDIEPSSWELFLVSERCGKYQICSCCSFCTFFAIGWLFVFIFIGKIAAVGDEVFVSEERQLTSDIQVKRYYGFSAAQRELDAGCGASDHSEKKVCEDDASCEWTRDRGGTCVAKSVCPRPEPIARTSMLAVFIAVYEAKGEDANILDDSVLNSIAGFEKKLLTTVDGAKYKGEPSPWADWCLQTVVPGDETGTTARCAPPQSLINLFGMDAAARATVESQVRTGYTYAGPLACMCSDADAMCSMCATTPVMMPGCLGSRRLGMNGSNGDDAAMMLNSSTFARLLVGSANCGSSSDPSAGQIASYLTSLCASPPSCQWAGPGLSSICSSSAFYHPSDRSGTLITGAEKETAITKMCDPTKKEYATFRLGHFDTDFDCAARKTKFAKTLFLAGTKEDTDANRLDFEENYIKAQNGWFPASLRLEQEAESASDGKLRIMMFATPLLRSQFMSLLIQDALLSCAALIMVWLYMWFALESCFLATCGIFEIVFSLPVGMSLWAVFLNQQISSLQILVIYMILGIGADDVFIINDAWQQSSYADASVTRTWQGRFAFAYRRSFYAMMVTTCTTCGSFIIGATSPLPEVRDFCIFASVVVFVDWIFCITFFASALVVYEKHFKGMACCSRACCGQPAPPAGKCLGPGMCWGCCRATFSKCGTTWKYIPRPPEKGEPAQPRSLEKFCEGPLFRFLSGLGGKILLGVWTILVLISLIVCATSLRTAKKAAPIGREHIDMTRALEVLMNEFPNFRQPKSFAYWGLDPEEPVKWGPSREKDLPSYKFGSASGIESEAGQLALLQLCRAADAGVSEGYRCESKNCVVQGAAASGICLKDDSVWRRHGVYVPADGSCQTGRYCFMEEFARFWAWTADGCPTMTDPATCGAAASCNWDSVAASCYPTKTENDYTGLPRQTFLQKLAGDEFKAYLERRQDVLRATGRQYDAELYNDMSGFRLTPELSHIAFAYIGWNATYAFQNTVEQSNEWYDRWQKFFNGNGGATTDGVQTMELYVFRASQNEMVSGAVQGIVLSLIVAFVVMLGATRNWRTTALGLLNIMAIVCIFLGLLPILGWSLGQYECIFMIATVGLSVDYTVHLLHAYNHSPAETRLERSRSALAEMGVSVVSSALTTLLAAFVLFFCGFYFFFQFGVFIFLVIGLSIVMSLTLLMPMAMLIGPEGDQGRIKVGFEKQVMETE